jgi:hypothetical protein
MNDGYQVLASIEVAGRGNAIALSFHKDMYESHGRVRAITPTFLGIMEGAAILRSDRGIYGKLQTRSKPTY